MRRKHRFLIAFAAAALTYGALYAAMGPAHCHRPCQHACGACGQQRLH